jgi:hypothetical protein
VLLGRLLIEVKITVGQLRRTIRKTLREQSMIQNTTTPETDDREPLQHMQLKTPDGEDSLSPHLIDFDNQDFDEGPVPRRSRKDDAQFAVQTDPYANDWSPAPSSRFGGR